MSATDEAKERGWFTRIANDLIKYPRFSKMPGNYAKVYMYIAYRQDYRTLLSRASVRRTAKWCGVSLTTVINARRMLKKWGALKIGSSPRKTSEIEIVKHFCDISPVNCSSSTERPPKIQRRAKSGRFVPAPRNCNVTTPRNVPCSKATKSFQTSSSQTSNDQPPPPPPPGGNGRSSEVDARPVCAEIESVLKETESQEEKEYRFRAKIDRQVKEKLAKRHYRF